MKSNYYSIILSSLLFLCTGCSPQSTKESIPKIAGHDVIQLHKIEVLSIEWKTVSSSQHNAYLTYTPSENYRQPNEVELYIPIDGMILSVTPFNNEKPLHNAAVSIQSNDEPAIFVNLYGVDLNSDEWGEGKVVKAGMHIGYVHVSEETHTASVRVVYQANEDHSELLLTSIMADYVFEHYKQRGIESPEYLAAHLTRVSTEPYKDKSFSIKFD